MRRKQIKFALVYIIVAVTSVTAELNELQTVSLNNISSEQFQIFQCYKRPLIRHFCRNIMRLKFNPVVEVKYQSASLACVGFLVAIFTFIGIRKPHTAR